MTYLPPSLLKHKINYQTKVLNLNSSNAYTAITSNMKIMLNQNSLVFSPKMIKVVTCLAEESDGYRCQ